VSVTLTDIRVEASISNHRYLRDSAQALNVEQQFQAMRVGAHAAAGTTQSGVAVALGGSGSALARSRARVFRTLFPENPAQIMSHPSKNAMLQAASSHGFNLRKNV
jgi:hypothetical protein